MSSLKPCKPFDLLPCASPDCDTVCIDPPEPIVPVIYLWGWQENANLSDDLPAQSWHTDTPEPSISLGVFKP